MQASETAQYRINRFFEVYAEAVANQDAKQIANCFALPCTFLADDSCAVYTDITKLEGLINQGKRFFTQHKIVEAYADVLNKRSVSDRITRVSVNWQYRDKNSQLVYDCDYYYLLKLNEEDKWKIEVAVSINEKERIEALNTK